MRSMLAFSLGPDVVVGNACQIEVHNVRLTSFGIPLTTARERSWILTGSSITEEYP